MESIDVALITQIMQFSKNKSMITIETKDGQKHSGIINGFDGAAVRLDNGQMINCSDIAAIKEGVAKKYDEFFGKRVHIKNSAGAIIDGVLYSEETETLQLITENGIEQISIGLVLSMQEASDVADSQEEAEVSDTIEDNNTSDTDIITNNQSSENDIDVSLPTFSSKLSEGSYYNFEADINGLGSLTVGERDECIRKFNEQEYYFVLNFLSNKSCVEDEKQIQDKMLVYLKQVIERYDESKKNLIPDGTFFYKGIIASKIELNLDKAFCLFVQSFEENPEKKKLAIYQAIVAYLSSKNYERASEVCDYLLPILKTVEPEYDQAPSLKIILNAYQNVNNWDKYLEILGYLVSVTKTHPIACANLILKYLAIVENEYSDVRIEKIYSDGLELGENLPAMILRYANYLSKTQDATEIDKIVRERINNEEAEALWSNLQANTLPDLLIAEDKYAFIQSALTEKTATNGMVKVEKSLIETDLEKKADKEKKNIVNEATTQTIEEGLEKKLRWYIDNNDYNGAKGHFARLLKKHDSDPLYISVNLRAELYYAQYSAFNKGIKSFSERYGNAMSKWLVDHETLEAENLFLVDFFSDSPTKGTTILSYIDMVAVEFGLADAITTMIELQKDIKYCERSEKVAFYEKKYTFAFYAGDIQNALNALETLKSTYYNKMKLGNCWYRSGECYRKLQKWKQAKNSYEKAIDYGYMKNVCEHQIILCRRNMGEIVDTETKLQVVELESIEIIKNKIESFYNDLRYEEANSYISGLAENYPDNEELAGIAKGVSETLQRYIDSGSSMPKSNRKDSQAIALRAWHIENNYGKARRFFEEEISRKGPKFVSCIMDLSELLLHTEGIDATISSLESYKEDIKTLKISDQSGYFERLYSIYLKKKNIDKMILSLNELISIYDQIGKKDKVAFSYYRAAIAAYQDKRYDETIVKMRKAIDGGYHSNTCYKCVSFSYAYMGKFDAAMNFLNEIERRDAKNDSNLQITLTELKEQITKIRNNPSKQYENSEDIQDDFQIEEIFSGIISSYDTRYEAYFVERYKRKPVGINIDQFEDEKFSENDVKLLERQALNHKWRERTGFYGTAAYIENFLNGNSSKYYELLRNSVNSWGFELQNNGYFDYAYTCFEFSLENKKNPSGELKSIIYCLSAMLRKRTSDMPDTDEETDKYSDPLKNTVNSLIQESMESIEQDNEGFWNKFILLIEKSPELRRLLKSTGAGTKNILFTQIANYISTDSDIKNDSITDLIDNRFRQEMNVLLVFISKIRASKAFNEEQLTELRSFRKKSLC